MEVIRNRNAKELAGQALEVLFKDVGGNPILFLSSGGSVLDILDGVDKNIFAQNFTIGVLDERYSKEPATNNSLQLREKLRDVINANWIDSVPEEKDTLETLASRMEFAWRKWRNANPGYKVIATMGIGIDGHTAGIFPGQKSPTSDVEDFRWVVGYDAGLASQFLLRVTTTFDFLRNEVDFAIVYISGGEKRPALEKVLADSGDLVETPARIFRKMKNVKIFSDIL